MLVRKTEVKLESFPIFSPDVLQIFEECRRRNGRWRTWKGRAGRGGRTADGRFDDWPMTCVHSAIHWTDLSLFFHLNHTKKRQGDFVAVSVCRSVRSTVFQFKTRSVVTAQTWKKIVSLPLTAKHGLDRISKRTSGTIQYGHKFSGSVRWS